MTRLATHLLFIGASIGIGLVGAIYTTIAAIELFGWPKGDFGWPLAVISAAVAYGFGHMEGKRTCGN